MSIAGTPVLVQLLHLQFGTASVCVTHRGIDSSLSLRTDMASDRSINWQELCNQFKLTGTLTEV